MRPPSHLRTVLWAFLGIRRRAASDEDLARIRPAALVAVALVLAGVFALSLWGLAHLAVHLLGQG